MEAQHINNKQELSKALRLLPAGARRLIIDAVGRPVGGYNYTETLTDYVHRVQDQLVRT